MKYSGPRGVHCVKCNTKGNCKEGCVLIGGFRSDKKKKSTKNINLSLTKKQFVLLYNLLIMAHANNIVIDRDTFFSIGGKMDDLLEKHKEIAVDKHGLPVL